MDEGRGAAGAQAGARAGRVREIDPEVGWFDPPTIETVVCEPCDRTERSTLTEHLSAEHANQFFSIEVDPAARTATIRRPERAVGFFNKFGG